VIVLAAIVAIAAGFTGTTMPTYDAALTEEERWALVTHLHTLQRDRPSTP